MATDMLSALQASARKGTLLSSCEPEVKELMHQLDVIISAKQREWEEERRSLLIKLDHKDKEIAVLRKDVQERKSEAEQLKAIQRSVEQEYHARHADQEAQLMRLRSELKRLHQNYNHLKSRRSTHGENQSLRGQVNEMKDGMALLEQQLRRREREMAILEQDRDQKVSILQESLRTKEEMIRTLEEQVTLARTSVQFSSYEAELNHVREALREHMEEEERLKRELARLRDEMKWRENSVVSELQERVERLEGKLREAQRHREEDSLQQNSSSVVREFEKHADGLTSHEVSHDYVALSPTNAEAKLSQALEGILDKHFNQLDSSLQAILSPK